MHEQCIPYSDDGTDFGEEDCTGLKMMLACERGGGGVMKGKP
jgi:hypothetical protein